MMQSDTIVEIEFMIHFVELSLLARLYKFQEAQFYAKIASHSLNAGLRYVFTTIQHHSN